jgi:outer membrane protein
MKKLYHIVWLSLLLPAGAGAQQATAESFTLEQAIAYALENSDNSKNAVIDQQIADAKVKETRGIGLPQISASASVLHNQQLSRFFSSYQVAQNFSGANIPGLSPTDVVASQNFFQLKSNGQAGLSINQLIFNASYLVGLKAANAYRELSEKQAQQTREQIIESVSKAYYGALVNNERIKLFDVNIARVDSLLRSTKAFNDNGFVESIDVDRIEVTLNNLQAERDKFVNLQQLSFELLKFQMNYPFEKELSLSGSIASLVMERDLSAFSSDWNYKNRVDYSILETNRELQSLNIRNKYSEGLPSLVAFADLGYNTQSQDIAGVFKTNSPNSDNGQIGPDKWYSTSSFGVSLNIPVFSGLQRTYRLKQERLTALKIENGFNSLKRGIDLDIKQNTTMYTNALRSLDAQDRNMKLAEKIAKVTKIKYEQGIGSNLEVVDAESALREAQVNYYNSLYDAMISRIDVLKAYGKINSLNTSSNQN